MEPLPLPTSLAEVEQPNPPETVSRIQEILQRLQKSPEGWQLAQSLIGNPNDNIKFYAALTIIVKLNKDSANLNDDEAKELLQNILGWTIASCAQGVAPFVIKKLCVALATFFIHFSQLWPNCLRHFLHSLDIGRATPIEALDDALETPIIANNLEISKLKVAVWFATSLVEEVGKTDMNSIKYIHVHERLVRNAFDLASLLARGFLPSDDAYQTQGESLVCFQAWILYAQRLSSNTDVLVTHLRELVGPALNCFAIDDLFQPAAELFSDVLSNYSGFFTEAHYASLASLFDSEWAAEHYNRVIHGDHQLDGISFGLLMLAYGDAKVSDLMCSTDERSQRFLARLAGLLAADGYLVGEDSIFVPALEFWATFVETMIDNIYSEDEAKVNVWRSHAEQHLKSVVSNCWRKAQWPPAETFAEWDSNERVGFTDARKDIADMLQSIFTLENLTLVSFFSGLFLQALSVQSWAEVEASAFCLGSLSDCITEDPQYDVELSKVFASPFFDLLGQAQGPVPLRLRQTGLLLIERYCEYFERHSEYLPHALNLLFAAVGDPVLGGPSAKSISTLCSSCRCILTSEAPAFIMHYQTIRSRQVLDSLAEERIILAIASIIQAIPDSNQKLAVFENLYSIIKADCERAVQLKQQPSILNLSDPNFLRGVEQPGDVPSADEVSQQLAVRALRSLQSMAKGMQDVKEHVVDIDADPFFASQDPKLSAIQSDILNVLVEMQKNFNTSGEIVEIICIIFRAGFSETEPGPFVFPPEVVTNFLSQQRFETPRLGTLLSTACSFVGSLYRGPKNMVPSLLAQLLPWVINMLSSLPEPESDTEVAQNGICFVDKIMTRYPEVVFQIQPSQMLEFFFMFSLKVLNGKEPLPKTASAEFWSNFITLKSDSPDLQGTINAAMEHLGPLISQTLIQNIGGNAARSELDKLSDPLKKLVTSQVRSRQWLEQALFDPSFPGQQVGNDEKSTFLRKIIGVMKRARKGSTKSSIVCIKGGRSYFHTQPSLFNHSSSYLQSSFTQTEFTTSQSTPTATPTKKAQRQVIFSGIQPTGIPHLGNYLGALQQWKRMQDGADPETTDLIFSVVDLHAITVPQQRGNLKKWKREMLAALLAIGLDPKRCTIFYQSMVPGHSELQWILSSADILVHRATHVPVGEDQRQHLEFARECVTNFNHAYKGKVLVAPETILSPTKRVMSLQLPTKKMSKSDPDPSSRILLTDTPSEIHAKILKARTDSLTPSLGITFDPIQRPGVSNLLQLLSHFDTQNRSAQEIAAQINAEVVGIHGGLGGEGEENPLRKLKERVSEVVQRELNPIREKYLKLLQEDGGKEGGHLDEVIREGARKANESAERTMSRVRRAVELGA
ncbi:hypothetical protein NEUTE1DRAFT_122164 [Neurospora tetrasperma FGSC 2508]|uniref:tryptophan--tRNA ligase n=1 Tax=Neurospora tetrasperma (strain FGSC 2508 / ATCC MYA-4615 / P0657) TaxID=510951 RepID=F8MMD5_NEUT8|nr:uncharacterized protein NEUTE1DRAFT_122164 [Neurospora tetrasperma FGSC 2508]EGO57809.1 hypothetical protein NEUTE1DRAFT_122164 [Neurospora tetrasperma FGSC 2508]